jgi:2-haloacid dehalogenase
MTHTLAFDVYGTLVDTAGVSTALAAHTGERAAEFARLWREKQLEYSFRRGLMRRYGAGFAQCTSEALAYACESVGIALDDEERAGLLATYRHLPAFPEVGRALAALAARGHRVHAFSNGRPEDLDALLGYAGLREAFATVVSVDPVRSFKPDPAVYAHFLACTGAAAEETWLVSSNPFDVIGAAAAGWRTAWVQRSPARRFDPWGVTPTLTVPALDALPDALPG